MTRHSMTPEQHLSAALLKDAEGHGDPAYLAWLEDLVALTPHDTPEGRIAALLVALGSLPPGRDRATLRIWRVLTNAVEAERARMDGDPPVWLQDIARQYARREMMP